MNKPARVYQSDIARAIRAAKQTGARVVEIKPDGTIVVRIDLQPMQDNEELKEVRF